MKQPTITKTINGLLRRVGLHVSRDTTFQGLKQTLATTEAERDKLRSQLLLNASKREQDRLLELSKTRWQSDEPDPGLTWGVSMSGDPFVEFFLKRLKLNDKSTIVEIGPGYGRLLEALLKHGVPFRRYIGLELSAARVNRLQKRFEDSRIEFRKADVLRHLDLNATSDVTISSAVFEHLYPDFSRALETIASFTKPGGAAVIDFIRDDNYVEKSDSWFEGEATFIRTYSESELKAIFEKSGFTLNEAVRISFGEDVTGREITRTVVHATLGTAAGPSIDALAATRTASNGVKPFASFVERNPAPAHDRSLEPPVKTQFRNRFGGLWTDLNTADALLAGKVEIGDILPQEGALVAKWIRDGFVILPGAVSAHAVDAAMADFEGAYDGLYERKMSYFDETGFHVGPASREHIRKVGAKLLELHDVSGPVQAAIFAPPVERFLQIIFQRPILAFQSLGFYCGSQQSIHQDCAYVRVSSPFEMVASWIALEDIQPGSGELEYYPGSHALPVYLFGEKNCWVDIGDPEHDQFSSNLEIRAQEAGLSKQRFTAKKGDVLIWSAGLMHGGGPVLDPNFTRKSIVTHYCPADQQPMYAYKGGRPKHRSVSGNYVMADFWEG